MTMKFEADYILGNRDICPHCGADSSHLYWGSLEIDGEHVTQEVQCNACNGEWYDVYGHVNVMEIKHEDS